MLLIPNTRTNTVERVIESRMLITLYIIADVVSLDPCRMDHRLNVIQTQNIFAALSTVSVVEHKSIAFVRLATTIVP
jgi:hypothetical protein